MIKSLEEEISIGLRASQAYNSYLQSVIASELNLLRDNLLDVETPEEISLIIAQIKAWKALGIRVLSDIDSGRLASLTLEKGN